jgi:hypothetical protein
VEQNPELKKTLYLVLPAVGLGVSASDICYRVSCTVHLSDYNTNEGVVFC